MFPVNSRIRIGHRVEYAFDVVGRTPFTMMSVPAVKDAVLIITDCDNIILSDDTYILTARGNWKMVCDLQQGELLKTVSCNAKILRLVKCDEPVNMFYASNSDRFVVNNFFIDG